jgi:hypothetical protein
LFFDEIRWTKFSFPHPYNFGPKIGPKDYGSQNFSSPASIGTVLVSSVCFTCLMRFCLPQGTDLLACWPGFGVFKMKFLEQNFDSKLRPKDLFGKYGKITILISFVQPILPYNKSDCTFIKKF